MNGEEAQLTGEALRCNLNLLAKEENLNYDPQKHQELVCALIQSIDQQICSMKRCLQTQQCIAKQLESLQLQEHFLHTKFPVHEKHNNEGPPDLVQLHRYSNLQQAQCERVKRRVESNSLFNDISELQQNWSQHQWYTMDPANTKELIKNDLMAVLLLWHFELLEYVDQWNKKKQGPNESIREILGHDCAAFNVGFQRQTTIAKLEFRSRMHGKTAYVKIEIEKAKDDYLVDVQRIPFNIACNIDEAFVYIKDGKPAKDFIDYWVWQCEPTIIKA